MFCGLLLPIPGVTASSGLRAAGYRPIAMDSVAESSSNLMRTQSSESWGTVSIQVSISGKEVADVIVWQSDLSEGQIRGSVQISVSQAAW